jgi:hypothetical protein
MAPRDLATCLRIISVYNTAAITVLQQSRATGKEDDSKLLGYPRPGGGLAPDVWATAVVKGADEKSPRWRHVLVLAGVLLGMESQDRHGLSRGLRFKLENALVTAANLALLQDAKDEWFTGEAIILALNHTFDLLHEEAKSGLAFDALIPVALDAMRGSEGYEHAQWLADITQDVRKAPEEKFEWPADSLAFAHLKDVAARPLVTSMGPFSRLLAYCVERAQSGQTVLSLLDGLQKFANLVHFQWSLCRLSNVDHTALQQHLTPETVQTTLPVLHQVLKSLMFATVNTLRSITSRTLIDRTLSHPPTSSIIATQTLLTLRALYFITQLLGPAGFSAHTFVFLTSIDILTHHPRSARDYIHAIRPVYTGVIPPNALDRTDDLWFLNSAEHFPLLLTPQQSEQLILTGAAPYLSLHEIPAAQATPSLRALFESAHSATLSVLSAPNNAVLAASQIPRYADNLFRSFPGILSPRQFRFAVKSLLSIANPPSPIATTAPNLSDELLEVLRWRAGQAGKAPLPPGLAHIEPPPEDGLEVDQAPQLSEQAVLALAMVDSLPVLTPTALWEWLSLAAELLNSMPEGEGKETVRKRFWDVLESGEMDVDRSAVCVAWWSTRGGREAVLGTRQGRHAVPTQANPVMSGGLAPPRDSRL